MRKQLRIRYTIVIGEQRAAQVAATLIELSKWFQLTPLPDDEWQFDVKDEPGLPKMDWSAPDEGIVAQQLMEQQPKIQEGP